MQPDQAGRQSTMERISFVLSFFSESDFRVKEWERSAGSASDMLSSEESGVYRPSAWSNHRQGAAECRKHY